MLRYEEIQFIVATKSWGDLIGQYESDFLDAKATIYDLSIDVNKAELAKDVTSFANSSGGFILLGVATKRPSTQSVDQINELKPFRNSLFNPDQYYDVINDWVYPRVNQIQIRWEPEREGSDYGFGIIAIPPQPEQLMPFLVTKVVLDSGKRRDILFGYAQRSRDRSEPKTLIELHQILRDGLHYSNRLDTRLSQIEVRLDRIQAPTQPTLSASEIQKRVNKALEATDLKTRRHFVLVASPDSYSELSDLFSAGVGTITEKLENPPVLRYAGFGLVYPTTSKIIDGEFRRVTSGSSKVLDLYFDGVLVFACAADQNFLALGTDNFGQMQKFNNVALAEVAYHFCLLYQEVLPRLTESPSKITFSVELGNLRPSGKALICLIPYEHGTAGWMWEEDLIEAPNDKIYGKITIPTEAFKPEAAAYAILERVYRGFGIGSDQFIPYTEEVNGEKAVSIQRIKSLKPY